ncbi:hypothetical protein [Winogradskya humida]|nr:hypothetical protein [Actinoplanes humidus]
MKRLGVVLLWIVGLYFVGRAVVEPFVIDLSDPATYRNDWGGPHLIGVLAVHALPGILALAAMVWRVRRRRATASSDSPVVSPAARGK